MMNDSGRNVPPFGLGDTYSTEGPLTLLPEVQSELDAELYKLLSLAVSSEPHGTVAATIWRLLKAYEHDAGVPLVRGRKLLPSGWEMYWKTSQGLPWGLFGSQGEGAAGKLYQCFVALITFVMNDDDPDLNKEHRDLVVRNLRIYLRCRGYDVETVKPPVADQNPVETFLAFGDRMEARLTEFRGRGRPSVEKQSIELSDGTAAIRYVDIEPDDEPFIPDDTSGRHPLLIRTELRQQLYLLFDEALAYAGPRLSWMPTLEERLQRLSRAVADIVSSCNRRNAESLQTEYWTARADVAQIDRQCRLHDLSAPVPQVPATSATEVQDTGDATLSLDERRFILLAEEIITRIREGTPQRWWDEVGNLSWKLEAIRKRLTPDRWPAFLIITLYENEEEPAVEGLALPVGMTSAGFMRLGDPLEVYGPESLLWWVKDGRREQFRESAAESQNAIQTLERWIRGIRKGLHRLSASTDQECNQEVVGLSPFSGGEITYFPDRVELCGATICSGSSTSTRRRILELLRERRHDGRFVRYSRAKLAAAVNVKPSRAGSAIRDLRTEIIEALRIEKRVACGRFDVVVRSKHGVHFADCLTVQDAELFGPPSEDDALGRDAPRNVRNPDTGIVRNVRNVRDGEAQQRQMWILEQLSLGVQLKAPMVAKQFGRNVKTAQRDLDTLRADGKIEFVGDPRTGYYELRDEPGATRGSS